MRTPDSDAPARTPLLSARPTARRRAYPSRASRASAALALGVLALGPLASCASVEFTRETETSGRFEASGRSVTFLSWDIPKSALDIARENVSDSRRPNLVIEKAWVRPHWGTFNWVLDIFSVRKAVIQGTWGFAGEDSEASDG